MPATTEQAKSVKPFDGSRITFKVYDCPNQLINELIAYAKLYEGNQVWRVIEKGMKLVKESKIDFEYFEKKDAEYKQYILDEMNVIKQDVETLKKLLVSAETKKKEGPSTLGKKKS